MERAAMNIILSTLNHTSSGTALNEFYASIPASTLRNFLPSQCSIANSTFKINDTAANQWLLSGTLPEKGTAQTTLGVLLQGLIHLFSLLTLALLFTPILPIVSEWPAQWLGLVYGLIPSKVQEIVEGTSVGENAAGLLGGREEGRLWLGSGGGEGVEGMPYLVLGWGERMFSFVACL